MARIEVVENGRHYWLSTKGVFLPRDYFREVTPVPWDNIKEILPQREPGMENPYIGKDGDDYHSYADLQAADKNRFRTMNPDKIQVFKKVA